MMQVGRYDYPSQLGDVCELLAEIEAMLLGGRYVLTDEVATFEAAFAEYVGVAHARGVNSGTDALVLALAALGIGAGDEVVVPANTFNATVAAILMAGARPVLIDVDERTFVAEPEGFAAAVTQRTRALLPVHLYGKPAPMEPLLSLAAQRGLVVVEDAAQAHGARLGGRRVGSFGDVACFSFHPSKNLAAAGDAGAVVASSDALDEQLRIRRALGQRAQDDHVVVGMNSKLDAIQALVLTRKLARLDGWNADRRRAAAWYRAALSGLPLTFQAEAEGDEHVYHLFQVRTELRQELLAHLRAHGVDAVVRYPVPIHLQPAFSHLGGRRGDHPVAERLARELLALPIRPNLTESDVGFVAEQVRAFFAGAP